MLSQNHFISLLFCLKNHAILLINSKSLSTDLESFYARKLHRNICRVVKF